MVENTHDDNQTTPTNEAVGAESTETAPKKTRRFFGSRRATRKGAETVVTTEASSSSAVGSRLNPAPNSPAPADGQGDGTRASGTDRKSTSGTDDNANVEGSAPAGSAESPRADGEPSAGQPTPSAGSDDTDDNADEGADSQPATASGPPASATSIVFQAPDIKPLPARTDSDEGEPSESKTRRRTRRRSNDDSRDDSGENGKSRRTRDETITEPQKVKGSTRLEAKKQRRRDGRDAGRRRPVITEAEFLARREAVDRTMIVRSKNGRIQIGVLEDSILVEHYVAKSQEASLIGNVYLGRVQNVLPSMEAAFVDIGRGRNAVLYSGEVDWSATENGNQPRRIETALKPGDKVLVQVTKDPVGHKGARLTSQVSLPGRYLVYVPNGSMNGISRKLPDTERARLKKILKEALPDDVGVIVRTAAEGASQEQLTHDVNRLTEQWAEISAKVESMQAPAVLHSEPDLLIKIIRDVFNEDFQKLVIAGDDAASTIEDYLSQVAPDLLGRVERHSGDRDLFDEYRISEQIDKALDRKVWLPSGGSLVIDRTEAMTVIDVNTGKFVGSGGNLEETVTKNNLEAAEEIVRQLRLRDIGGIIVVDFIDMVLESNRDLVLRRLIECLSRDRTKHQVAEVTSLGLVQMTRKKLGLGLLESFSEACEVCAGRGVIVHHDPIVKHRQQPERRRGKNGGSSGSNSNGNHAHAITDDAKNALAQIAASTLASHSDAAARHTETGDAAEASQAASADVGEAAAAPEAEKSQPKEPEPESETLAILDIPIAPARAARPKITSEDATQLLDSVLDALPEPKLPGEGRNRRRRVSTAALSGGTKPTTEGDES